MKIINFSHPLTAENIKEVESLAGQTVDEVLEFPCPISFDECIVSQWQTFINNCGVTESQWQGEMLLVGLPSLNISAAVALAILHGKMGHFPVVLRSVPRQNGPFISYQVAELLNLQTVRAEHRSVAQLCREQPKNQ